MRKDTLCKYWKVSQNIRDQSRRPGSDTTKENFQKVFIQNGKYITQNVSLCKHLPKETQQRSCDGSSIQDHESGH